MLKIGKPNLTKRAAEVLDLLEQAEGWYSGTVISQHLEISRAAISKHVKTLRDAGYIIEGVTQRGYKLIVKPCIINLAYLKSHLNTQILGQQSWEIFKTIGSSNQEAARLAMDGAATGTIIVAKHQSQGRGNKGHKWFSAPRSLQFSVILRDQKQEFDLHVLTHEAMGAVAKTIEDISGLKAVLKQPNDVFLNGKKIAGILVETGFRGKELDYIVLGIGCNVNTMREDFPPELLDKCTSLFAETGKSFDLNLFIIALLQNLEKSCENSF